MITDVPVNGARLSPGARRMAELIAPAICQHSGRPEKLMEGVIDCKCTARKPLTDQSASVGRVTIAGRPDGHAPDTGGSTHATRVDPMDTDPNWFFPGEIQVLTHAALREARNPESWVVADLRIHLNELVSRPDPGDVVRLKQQVQWGETDVVIYIGSVFASELNEWQHGEASLDFPLEFRLYRAYRIVRVDTEFVTHAISASCQIALSIEQAHDRKQACVTNSPVGALQLLRRTGMCPRFRT